MKKEHFQTVIICLLTLNLINVSKVNAPNDSNSQTEIEQIIESVKENDTTEQERILTEDDVWSMEHEDSEHFRYVPLRAFKAEYKGTEYFYLYDNEDSMYISFDDLIDGGNYIGEVEKTNDKLCELKNGGFEFTEEYEQDYIKYATEDREVAEKILENMIIDL